MHYKFFLYFFMCITLYASQLDKKSQEIVDRVAYSLKTIALPDGMNIYGDIIEEQTMLNFSWTTLSITTKSIDIESDFWLALCNPIKHEGIFWNTYYTPEEIVENFKKLLNMMQAFNESLMMMLQSTFEDGCIYRARLPGLKKQPERAELYKSLKFCARKYKEKTPYKITDFLEAATFHYKKIRFTYYMNALQAIFQQERLEREIKKSLSMIEIEYGTGILLLSKQELIERESIERENVLLKFETKIKEIFLQSFFILEEIYRHGELHKSQIPYLRHLEAQTFSSYFLLYGLYQIKTKINPKKENQTKTKPHEKSE